MITKGSSLGSTKTRQFFPEMEIWGGAEYTCNRVGDLYFDQMELSGHAKRVEDCRCFSDLGIRATRIGLLWERHEQTPSWHWEDERLRLLKDLCIKPIVGLLHHGSGPKHTNLLDPEFPRKLADYAQRVAERYAWVEAYTPVNEPNTTARFSALYGIWYPHERSQRSYMKALCNQLKATVLSMRRIRSVQPKAQLIQTDDVGVISGTDELRHTWETLNLRQWLTFDLLCGTVDRNHPLFRNMCTAGLQESEIYWFAENPCPPDVLGLNYYATSDRYLDHRVQLYPQNRRSAEGRFVDVEAVRVQRDGIAGVGSRLMEAWKRYRIPLALTEVHLGCTVDEQIRWLAEVHSQALEARRAGVQCVALTIWSLFGSYYWNELVTKANSHYEPGVYDVSSGRPIPSELAATVRQIAKGESPDHPAISSCGWWKHPSRICFTPEENEKAADELLPAYA